MNVRKATINDLPQLSELFDQYRQFYKQKTDIAGAKAFISNRLSKDQSVIYVVEKDNELLGFTQLFPSFSSVSMQRQWILNDLFVALNARKSGVAQLLMDAAKNWSEETNSKGVALETDADNVNAQKLYNKLGYQRESDTYHFYLAVQNTK